MPSHASLFSGLSPLHHGTHYGAAVPGETTLLAEILRDAGYSTAAITGGVLLHPKFGFTQGFDRYYYWPSQAPSGKQELANGIERALAFLDDHTGGPFFLFFHTYEVHSPYRARDPFHSRFGKQQGEDLQSPVRPERLPATPENGFVTSFKYSSSENPTSPAGALSVELRSALTALYDSGIAYADNEIGRLLQRIEQLGLAGKTLVVLTSDHGESLGEQGRAMHYHLYDENLRVPLVMALPGTLPSGRKIEEQVRLIDVAPTIMEVIDVPIPPGIDGVSLLSLINGSAAPDATKEAWSYAPRTNWGVSLRLNNRLKYIFFNSPWETGRGLEELYDLREDPGELEDVADLRKRESDALRRRVQLALEQIDGLRLQFFNRSQGTLSGTLSGRFGPNAVKSSRGPNCLEWAGDRTKFRVAAKETCTVTIEAHGEGSFVFEGTWRGPTGESSPFRWSVLPPQSEETRAFFLDVDKTGWTESARADGRVGMIVSQMGRASSKPVSVSEDERLLQDLRALGYLQ